MFHSIAPTCATHYGPAKASGRGQCSQCRDERLTKPGRDGHGTPVVLPKVAPQVTCRRRIETTLALYTDTTDTGQMWALMDAVTEALQLKEEQRLG